MKWGWIVLVLIAPGCSPQPESTAKSAPGKSILVLALTNNPSTLDPALSQDSPTNDIMRQVFEGLVRWGEDNQIEPSLAESWTASPDGRTYAFKIRKGVKFHNGKELTANDFKWTWVRNSNPKFNSPLASNYLGDIVGVKERVAGASEAISGVTVKDPLTLIVTLDKPRPYFLGKLTYPATFVLPSHSVKEGEIIATVAEMIGTGPFKAASFDPQQELALDSNANYREGAPSIDRLRYRILKDAATRSNLFKTGEIDVLSLSQQDIGAYKNDPKLSKLMKSSPRPSVNYIGMNGTVYKPFADVRVRRAFVMAVNREQIVTNILKGAGQVADGILPPAVPMPPRTVQLPSFNPGAAKAILREAGWEKLPPLELWTSDANQDRRSIAELVVTQISQNLGVDAKLHLAENSIIIQKATKKQLGFFYGNWFADYLDPENFLSVLLADYGQNRTAYDNPEFSALCLAADSETDPAKRLQLYAKAEAIVMMDCPWIPLYFPEDVSVIQPWVSGLRENGFGYLPHSKVKVGPKR